MLLSASAIGAVLALWLTDGDPGRTSTTLMTAGIALLVAGITALATDARQDRQLKHEERVLGARFAHERVMPLQREVARLPTHPAADDEVGVALVDESCGCCTGYGRLTLRFGTQNELSIALKKALDVIFETVKDVRQFVATAEPQRVTARAERGEEEFATALEDFTAKARRKIGTAQEIVDA